MATGAQAQIAVSDSGLASTTMTVPTSIFGPAFFLLGGKYAAALHGNNTVVGPATLVANNSTPAKPGETIALFATGLGTTNPAIPNGQVVSSTAMLSAVPTVTIGGLSAPVTFSGLTGTGLYQVNVMVPAAARTATTRSSSRSAGFPLPEVFS